MPSQHNPVDQPTPTPPTADDRDAGTLSSSLELHAKTAYNSDTSLVGISAIFCDVSHHILAFHIVIGNTQGTRVMLVVCSFQKTPRDFLYNH